MNDKEKEKKEMKKIQGGKKERWQKKKKGK